MVNRYNIENYNSNLLKGIVEE